MSESPKTPTFSRREIAGLAAATAALAATPALADQPHMEKALMFCKSALKELKDARSNKGGHRIKAIEQLKIVIDQIEAGIEHAD